MAKRAAVAEEVAVAEQVIGAEEVEVEALEEAEAEVVSLMTSPPSTTPSI